jgi:hypothetical protein
VSVERAIYKVRRFVCETCKTEREQLQWNYDPAPVCCDRSMAEGSLGPAQTLQIITDDVPGGFVVENGFSAPTRFDSRSAHRRALAESRGMRIADKGEFRV